jgi:hypothetical protein
VIKKTSGSGDEMPNRCHSARGVCGCARLEDVRNGAGLVAVGKGVTVNERKREDVMVRNSEILVVIIMLPVLLQIVVPLAMLFVYGLLTALRSLFIGDELGGVAPGEVQEDKQLQLGRV